MTNGKVNIAHTKDATLRNQIARASFLTKLVVLIEGIVPRLILPLAIAAIFTSLAWFGLFRALHDWLRFILSFTLIFTFFLSLFPLLRLRWLSDDDAVATLERRSGLAHQPLQVQGDHLSNDDSPLAKALWLEHQKRMTQKLAGLKVGYPEPDVTAQDPYALRTIPALLLVIAIAFQQSNSSGSLMDAFRFNLLGAGTQDNLRIDAWITPPAYTSRAPIFLKAASDGAPNLVEAPSGSILTIRTIGGTDSTVQLTPEGAEAASLAAKVDESATVAQAGTANYEATLLQSAKLTIGSSTWNLAITPDALPTIAFKDKPKSSVNGTLEIAFTASDDWGVTKAYAEITPLEPKDGAVALFEPPEFNLTFSRQNPRDINSSSSKDFAEHPLAGKRVAIRLIVEDGAGQQGQSATQEIIFPGKSFNDPLAASIAEQRQIFSLDVNSLQKSLDYNEAIGLRADETIPKLAHYLLLQSVRGRMESVRNGEDLFEAADYLWNVALEIEDANLSDAQRRLKEAQKNLADALEQGASNEEIAKLTEELRKAMNALVQELAQRGQNQPQGQQSQNNQNVVRQRDLENMMKQIENLARSGDREAAQQLMSELQRMLNNLQMAQPQRNQSQQGEPSKAEKQIEKLGEILQKQQKLMDETFSLDQQQRQREDQERMQRDFPQEKQEGEAPNEQTDEQTAEALREALKKLREQQDSLAKDLKELQEALEGMGAEQLKGFGKAEREMRGAGESLGKGNGERATERQGEALNALRDGAKQMMQQMMKNMQAQQGEQPGQGERDPLGRDNGNSLNQEYKIPDEMDVQRAREILNAIGEKLGRGQLNEIEKQYLERLLGTQ